MLMHLVPDLPARRDGHEDDLGVFTGPEDLPEVPVLLRDVRDGEVLDVSLDAEMLLGRFSYPSDLRCRLLVTHVNESLGRTGARVLGAAVRQRRRPRLLFRAP